MSNGKIFIHTGYIKTGTTWLQNMIFNNHERINYLGKTEADYPQWLINWHYYDDCFFERNYGALKSEISGLLDDGKVNLISSEAFTLPGGQILNQARRIKKVVDNPKIILTLRNPIDLVYSYYKDDMNNGDYLSSLEDSIDWKRTPFVYYKRRPIYLPDFFFNETIDEYENLFGRENICVLKFEDMIARPEKFFAELGDFMGIEFDAAAAGKLLSVKMNKSPEAKDIPGRRAANARVFLEKHFPGSTRNITDEDLLPAPESVEMTKDLRTRLEEYFRGKCYDYLPDE